VGEATVAANEAAETPQRSKEIVVETRIVERHSQMPFITLEKNMSSNVRKRRTPALAVAAIAALAVISLAAAAPLQAQTYTGVLTWHNDNQRTGQNLAETILTPANVNPKEFGKLFTYAVDGQIYAQPLYVSSVTIPNLGVHNVVYVATENDSVYAFDADGLVTTPLWQVSLILNSGSAVPCGATGACSGIGPVIGITGTPVIDGLSGTLYVVAFTAENGSWVQRLHALDITTGVEKFNGPTVIEASVPGTGGGAVGGNVAFEAIHESQRTALLLSNGIVYMGWGTFAYAPWHGWIMGYDAQTMKQVAFYNDTANGKRGGIWNSGSGFAADIEDNIYVLTGDGTFDGNTGGVDYGDSFLRLTPTGTNGLSVADYFTPFNQSYLSTNDLDVGSGGGLIVPTQGGAHPEEIIGGGKESMIFVCDRTNLGGYSSTTNNNVQTVTAPGNGFWSSPAYWNGFIYYSGSASPLVAYSLTNGLLSTSPVAEGPTTFAFPGTTPSISANGSKTGIVWVIQDPSGMPKGGAPAVLRAYEASNVTKQIYGSSQMGTRDAAGPGVKFAVPTVYNGKVYVGTQTGLTVYGLLPTK